MCDNITELTAMRNIGKTRKKIENNRYQCSRKLKKLESKENFLPLKKMSRNMFSSFIHS